ncbi:unnamed protein product [Ectocarpus sp. 8 AP-2014]
MVQYHLTLLWCCVMVSCDASVAVGGWMCLHGNGYYLDEMNARGATLRLHGGAMIVVFTKYPHLLDEAPGLGDLKTTAPPRQDEYAPPPTMPSTSL